MSPSVRATTNSIIMNKGNRGPRRRNWRDGRFFWGAMATFGCAYLFLIVSLLVVDMRFVSGEDLRAALGDQRVRYSMQLSLISSTLSALVSTWIAVPTGYLLARSGSRALRRRSRVGPGWQRCRRLVRTCVETLFDMPLVFPPLAMGISLLVLFQTPAGRWVDARVAEWMAGLGFPGIRGVSYEVPAVILAQCTVAAAYAIRILRATFERIDPEPERLALVLGASEWQAFSWVALPQARQGMINAFTMAWARSLGEFGPILVFAGMTRMKTEVLSTTVYLNFSIGNLRGAVTAALLLLTLASVMLIALRTATGWQEDRADD